METDKPYFSIPGNNFSNIDSEFESLTTLNTTSFQTRPFYPQISIAKNKEGIKSIAVKTSASLTLVQFDKTKYLDYKKLFINDRIDKEVISAFTFSSPWFSASDPQTLVIGYKSGLIVVHTESQPINALNIDERVRDCFHKQAVNLLITTPNNEEVIAVFNDSSMIKYNIRSKSVNQLYIDKLKRFSTKISFNQAAVKYRKTANSITQGAFVSVKNPEQSNFYLINHDTVNVNPISYYLFNCRTIADAVIVSHERFNKSFLKNCEHKNSTILAFVNYDGHLVVFDYEKMDPQFSLKSFFGGYNTLTFSPNCEYLALSGHDDCITLFSVDTLSVVKCIGHKSFVSKSIFQTIPFDEKQNTADAKSALFAKNDYIRLIGGSMDGNLSFYEIEKDTLAGNKNIPNVKAGPMFLNLNSLPEPQEIKPIQTHKLNDSIGWIEIADNLMVTCCMDGTITIYRVRNVTPPEEEEEAKNDKIEETNSPSAQNKNKNFALATMDRFSYSNVGDAVERNAGDSNPTDNAKSKPKDTIMPAEQQERKADEAENSQEQTNDISSNPSLTP